MEKSKKISGGSLKTLHYIPTDKDIVNITLPLCYAPIFQNSNHMILLKGGRLSGKTKSCILTILSTMLNDPYHDWVVFRSTMSSFRDSTKNELESAIASDKKLSANFRVCKTPLEIRRIKGAGTVYFKGADSIGQDNGKTKGLKTVHPLKGVMIEEAQQFRDKDAIDQALASARRNFTDENGNVCEDWKIIVVYNPPQSEQHWINQWEIELEKDPDWTIIDTSYLDILPFINDIDLKEILKDKEKDKDHYDWFYMGKVGGGSGQVYPTLTPDLLIPVSSIARKSNNQRPVAVLIGCDGAVDRDCTEFAVGVVLEDGSVWFRQRDCFHWNPKEMGVMPSYPLCERYAYKWFYGWNDEHGMHDGILTRYRDITGRYRLPIMFFVDDAATELYQAIRTYFGKYSAIVSKTHKGTISNMVDCVRGAFLKKKAWFVKDDGWMDYSKETPKMVSGAFLNYEQLRSLRWEPGNYTKYDDNIPNDASDAVTYALWSWFKNPANIAYGQLIANE